MKKLFALFLTCALLLSSVAALAEAPKEVIIWDHFGELTKQSGADQLAAACSEKYPEYKFIVKHLDYTTYIQQVKTGFATGEAPDIFQGRAYEFVELVEAGKIAKLDDKAYAQRIRDISLEEGKYEDIVYAVPTDLEVSCIYYNRDVFTDNNIAIPTNRAELLDACEKLKAAGIVPFSVGLMDVSACLDIFEYFWYPRLLDEGMNNFAELRAKGEVKFADSAAFKQTLKDYNEIILANCDPNALSTDRSQTLVDVANGKAAMTLTANWSLGDLKANNTEADISTLPFLIYDEAERNGVMLSVDDIFMVSADSKVPEGADLYLDFITSNEGIAIWSAASKMLSASKEAKLSADGDSTVAEMLDYINSADRLYYRKDMAQFSGTNYTNMQRIMQSYIAMDDAERADYDAVAEYFDEEFDAMQ